MASVSFSLPINAGSLWRPYSPQSTAASIISHQRVSCQPVPRLKHLSTLLLDDEVVRFAEEITYKYQSVLFSVDSGSGRVVMNANLDHIRDLGKIWYVKKAAVSLSRSPICGRGGEDLPISGVLELTFDKYLAQHYFRNRNLPYDRNNSSEPPSAAGESGKSSFFCPLGYATAAFITAVGRPAALHLGVVHRENFDPVNDPEMERGWTYYRQKLESPLWDRYFLDHN
eukprot:g14583.t1